MAQSDDQSNSLMQGPGSTSLQEGSFHSRSSFNGPGQGEAYDKTLFNMCYLI